MSLIAPIVGGITSAVVGSAMGGGGSGSQSGSSSGTSTRTYQPFETASNDLATKISRGSWDYAKQFYTPIEKSLMDKSWVIDEGQVFNRGQLAQQGVDQGFRAHQRDLMRQGATLSAQQIRALDRDRQLDIATGRAAAQNQDRQGQYERNLNTLATLAGFGRSSIKSALEASSAAAGMETQRNVSGGYTDKSTSTTKSKSSGGGGGSI